MAGEPKSIDYLETLDFIESLDERIKPYYLQLANTGWRFYITHQNRGYCQYAWKTITIPSWVLKHPKAKQTWYMAHEMAHAFSEKDRGHGSEFMAQLIRICPEDCIHYELGYKPRNAKAAGIGEVKFLEL